jgi:hypothetical protein
VYDVGRASDCPRKGLSIKQVSFDEFELVEVLSESLSKGCNFRFVFGVSYSAANVELAALEEV